MTELLYINWDYDPIIVNIFGKIPVGYYGILFVTGIWLCYLLVKRMYIKEKLSPENAGKLLFYVFAGVLAGSRLGHCLFYDFGYFSSRPLEIILPVSFTGTGAVWTGYRGLASHGGAVGLIIAILIYSHIHKEKFLNIIDKIAVVTPLAGAFIRIGNLFNSEIIGKQAAEYPFAFIFRRVDNIPRHPAQLYEAICYLIIFSILWWLYSKYSQKLKSGFFLGISIFLIFSARFFIEFFKENQSPFESDMIINMGQVLSIPFVIAGISIIIFTLIINKASGFRTGRQKKLNPGHKE